MVRIWKIRMKKILNFTFYILHFTFLLQASALTLEEGFANPPPSARPQVWWHWMNGNVSKDGITADLEAMARAGIGGVEIFDAASGIPEGDVPFASDKWFEMLRHSHEEGKRLGVDIVLANCSGWSSSGGPWVTPEDSMKQVVFAERLVRGGERIAEPLPVPADTHGFYRDIATIAFPRPTAEAIDSKDYGMRSTFKSGDQTAKIVFDRPFPLTGLTLDVEASSGYLDATVRIDISEDGENFRTAVKDMILYTARYQVRGGSFFVPVAEGPVNVRAVKVFCDMAVELAVPGPAWEGEKTVRPARAKGLKSPNQRITAIRPEARAMIPEFAVKTFAMRAKVQGVKYAADKDRTVDPARIARLPDGGAGWTAPAGTDWIVMRVGYASNGMVNHPATRCGKGLEVDKLSKAAVGRFFDGYIGKALERIGPLLPKGGVRAVHVDSYEVGGQNWTDGFERIFKERKGYDIVKYLPVLAGRVVDSPERTDRFLADMRRVVSDLFIENYAGEMQRLCHAHGLLFSLEGYGCCPCDDVRYAARCDIPMCEFWAGQVDASNPSFCIGNTGNSRFAASIAHVWGRRFVAAEAFTSLSERYDRDPYACKSQGDRAYCQGVNRLVFHSSAHQPWRGNGNGPGMTMGNIGSHFETTQTWWEDGGAAWFKYQARCQWMLQEGVAASDILVFTGDAPENYGLNLTRWHDYALVGENAFGIGRQWDICGGEAIVASSAEGGEVATPGGARYKAVAMLPGIAIDPESQAALERLAKADVPVVPAADVHKALLAKGIGPDVVCLTKECSKDFRWIHRRGTGNGERGTDWYFVALPNEKAASFNLVFRQSGKIPEIWNPETGKVSAPFFWREKDGRTTVRLDFDPSGAAFVVFRKKGTKATEETEATVSVVSAVPVSSPWRVTFPIGWYFEKCRVESVKCRVGERGMGNGEREMGEQVKVVEWPELKDWSSDADPDIKYFSGTATYKCKVENVKCKIGGRAGRVFLNLGEVKNIATVTINGKTFPVLWKPPYRVDITEAVENGERDSLDIKVKVTNLWPNRLIGDDALPEGDVHYNPKTKKWKGGGLKSIPKRVFENKPPLEGRHTFTTWRHWKSDDKLLPSGLLGPVRIEISK